jgi:hypothetical protein
VPMSRRGLNGLLVALAVVAGGSALAACSGSSGSSSSTTVPPGKAGLGASLSSWQSVHPPTSAGGTSGYGTTVTVDGKSVPQFTAVQVHSGKVVAFHQSFPSGTKLGTAEASVRQELPTDIEQTASWRGNYATAGKYCEFVNYRSEELSGILGSGSLSSTQSNIGVTLYRIEHGQAGTPSIAVVNSADVNTTPRTVGQSC